MTSPDSAEIKRRTRLDLLAGRARALAEECDTRAATGSGLLSGRLEAAIVAVEGAVDELRRFRDTDEGSARPAGAIVSLDEHRDAVDGFALGSWREG